MTAPVRITETAIRETALQMVRDHGAQALNARALAAALGCSTQPIFKNFPSMEALRRAVVDSCTISSSPEGESVYAEEYRERFLGKEFELYTLDDEGRVSSASQDQGLLQGETGVDYVAESTTWYNAYGQVTRTEQYTSSDSYTNRTVTETEYRP